MKKIISILSGLLISITTVFALPGVTSIIPDTSGQFVYYRDYSFERETYFGIIYYDEATYGVRYFSPADTTVYPIKPKKDIQILFSLDTTKKYVELAGERILSVVYPEDTDLINYLHDAMYEFTGRRSKAGIIDSVTDIEDEYEQFGGDVIMTYDPLVPVFNLKSITDKNGKKVFKIITAGKLNSSKDEDFKSFEGLPLKVEDNDHTFTLNKKSKKEKIVYKKLENHQQTITLDNQWTAKAENLYLLGNTAVLALDVISISEASSTNKESIINLLCRSFSFNLNESYPYLENTTVTEHKNSTTYSNLIYNPVTKSFKRDFKTLTKINEDTYALMTLTVFQGPYSRNNKYFDNIIKSYSAN